MKLFKYPIAPLEGKAGTALTRIPKGAIILSVNVQANKFVAYALVDPSKPNTDVRFELAFTGETVEANRKHLLTHEGIDGYVYHVFLHTGP